MDIRGDIQKEAIETALKYKYGTLNISVRVGKTYIGLQIASKFDKVLVSYPNISIKNSWLEDSRKFNIPIDNIEFTTHISLDKYSLRDYDVVILDEVDQVSENSINWIILNLPNRMYGLTGTPPTIGVKRDFIENYCPIIYRKSLEEVTGILVKDYRINVHLLTPSTKLDVVLKSGKKWSEKAQIQFWENKYNSSYRFNDMLQLIRAVQNSKTKFNYLKSLKIERGIYFLETTKQCDELGFPSYHSKEPLSELHLEQFQTGEINHLSSILQLKAGITFPDLKECVLLHCYSSSSKAHQRIARILNYTEEQATAHILCLRDTRDVEWCKKGLEGFDKSKINWIKV